MFPAYDAEIGRSTSTTLDPVVFDPASGRMVITYQTFVVRTPKHTVLVDTCTGEDKGYPAPMDFPKQPWLDGFKAAGLRLRGHHARLLHASAHRPHRLEHDAARWPLGADVPERQVHLPQGRVRLLGSRRRRTAANPPGNVWTYNCRPIVEAGQALLVDDTYELDDTFTLTPTPGHSPCHCCVNIRSRGQRAVVTGDMMHHALQCREPDWSTIFDIDHEAGGAVAPQLPRQGRRHQHADPADPLSQPDRRPRHRLGEGLRLQVRALISAGLVDASPRMDARCQFGMVRASFGGGLACKLKTLARMISSSLAPARPALPSRIACRPTRAIACCCWKRGRRAIPGRGSRSATPSCSPIQLPTGCIRPNPSPTPTAAACRCRAARFSAARVRSTGSPSSGARRRTSIPGRRWAIAAGAIAMCCRIFKRMESYRGGRRRHLSRPRGADPRHQSRADRPLCSRR